MNGRAVFFLVFGALQLVISVLCWLVWLDPAMQYATSILDFAVWAGPITGVLGLAFLVWAALTLRQNREPQT